MSQPSRPPAQGSLVISASLLLLALLVVAAWWWPNRPMDPIPGLRAEKFNSLSFSAYRPWESPLANRFPTEAEADSDLALLAGSTRAVRSYAAIEGDFDTAALARKHGLKLWQGIWLGGDRAHNEIEIARGIEIARNYPDVVERVIVGNEVLLRRDLPVGELISDIDRVRAAVKQPVAYADVSDFWLQFPKVAPHVDVILIHLLPYWEDTPTGIDDAVTYVGQVYRRFVAQFPGKKIAIGETGWPSRGRQRQGAVPGRVNEARFLRGFIALSQAEHFDYNFIEAFDQVWKYQSEGVVGANWGIFDSSRDRKIPLRGPIEEDPLWRFHAAISIVFGFVLSGQGLSLAPIRTARICVVGMALGLALGFAWAGTVPLLYDWHLRLAAVFNLGGQSLLAALMMLRLAGAVPPALRNGADATEAVRSILLGKWLGMHGAFEDLSFVFVWAASVLQVLLLFDPRYREFPLASFAVPATVVLVRIAIADLPRRGGGREEALAAGTLVVAALASLVQEGPENGQAWAWTMCAALLATPLVMRFGSGEYQAIRAYVAARSRRRALPRPRPR